MKKIIGFISIFAISLLTIQTGFAEENNAGTLYVNIGSETKAIAFNPDKTARVDVQPDQTHKSVQISLPPGSTGEIMLPSCDNQHITANQSVNCPVSSSSPTTLTLVDASHWTSSQKGAFIGGITGATIGGATGLATGALAGLAGGPVGIVVGAILGAITSAIILGSISTGIGAGVGAGIGA